MKCKACGSEMYFENNVAYLTNPIKYCCICPKCGLREYMYENNVLTNNTFSDNYTLKGWECPKCGAVMSPSEKVCINCTGKTTILY